MTLLEDYGDWSTEQTRKANKYIQDNEYLRRTLQGLISEHGDTDITIEKFEELVKALHEVNLTHVMEETDNTDLSGELACAGGSCEITSL